jgi:hypothetical protein
MRAALLRWAPSATSVTRGHSIIEKACKFCLLTAPTGYLTDAQMQNSNFGNCVCEGSDGEACWRWGDRGDTDP